MFNLINLPLIHLTILHFCFTNTYIKFFIIIYVTYSIYYNVLITQYFHAQIFQCTRALAQVFLLVVIKKNYPNCMAVPKKRTCILKKKFVKIFGKKRRYWTALKAFSLAQSIFAGKSKSFFCNK